MERECEGRCFAHKGEVKRVTVYCSKSGSHWGAFNYCEAAISNDRMRGLTVRPVKED